MERGRAAALALLLAAALPAAAEVPVPRLTGPVVDQAGVLDDRWEQRLGDLSRAARARDGGKGPQLQYLLVPTLDGEPIESFAMRVAEAWKLGTKGRDDGVLVVVAVKDRRVRIEVGGGIEGGLTDAQSVRIIRGAIVPAFREGRYGEGLYAAGQQILGALGALPPGAQGGRQRAEPKEIDIPVVGTLLAFLLGLGSPALILLVIFFVIVRALSAGARGVRRGPRGPWGGGWGGGGGWSGGGGGGWSGGGGGFSGGGASGSW
ncbi:MAG TPA: TPM domain-containing protein [Anaeromyxobacteraceae bacterium]|nr:TPM domain-containing protein [Anaeromyxobacteraceae bacterium]